VVGKPSPDFFQAVLQDLGGIRLEDAVMVGDDVRDDVGGAQQLGIAGILGKGAVSRTYETNKQTNRH
jgi:FMN phosphatase YigB (HAD superfamily)